MIIPELNTFDSILISNKLLHQFSPHSGAKLSVFGLINEDDPKNEDNPKNENAPKNKDTPKNQDDP